MSKELEVKCVDDYQTLSEIVDDLIDEKKYPLIRLLQNPPLATQTIPVIIRARLNLLKAWKRFTDSPMATENEETIAEEILTYAAVILVIATDIRDGNYVYQHLLSPGSIGRCYEMSKQFAENLKAASIGYFTSSQWRMGTQAIYFGDVVNIAGLTLDWKSGSAVFHKKMYIQELINDDEMKGDC